MKWSELNDSEIQLLDAARAGDLSAVVRLLSEGVAVDTKDNRDFPFDVTPLMHAARAGHDEVVRVLLDAGANVKAKDKHMPGEGGGWTALHYAARGKHVEVARRLVAAGADVNAMARGSEGTPLHSALEREPMRISVEDILNPDRIRNRDTRPSPDELDRVFKIVTFLLSVGAKANLRNKGLGLTPLDGSVAFGSTKLLELLVSNGADINAQDNQGHTAFVSAAIGNRMDIAIWLIENGLNLTLKDKDGFTHLMWAVLSGKADLVKAVLNKGVDLHCKTSDGETALSLSIRDEHKDVEQILREAGAKE